LHHIKLVLYKIRIFFIHGSAHRNSVLIRSNKIQEYAGIYLLQNYSTYFVCPSHPSSGVHKTVTAASGTGHSYLSKNVTKLTGLVRGRFLLRYYDLYRRLLLQCV